MAYPPCLSIEVIGISGVQLQKWGHPLKGTCQYEGSDLKIEFIIHGVRLKD
jgi:hypothetical protein